MRGWRCRGLASSFSLDTVSVWMEMRRYVLKKLPMYFAFFGRGGEKEWKRTERDTPSMPPPPAAPQH